MRVNISLIGRHIHKASNFLLCCLTLCTSACNYRQAEHTSRLSASH